MNLHLKSEILSFDILNCSIIEKLGELFTITSWGQKWKWRLYMIFHKRNIEYVQGKFVSCVFSKGLGLFPDRGVDQR